MSAIHTDRADGPEAYPRTWEADVVLSDGAVALVRPIAPEDIDGVRRFHAAQSAESIYLRFFAPLPQISDKDLRHFTHVDYINRVALVVIIDDQIAGIGRFDRLPEPEESSAEVAFNVSDAHQGRGIASVLLEHLADIGSQRGLRRFLADVLPQNRRMLGVFRDAGYEVSNEYDDGLLVVSFDIEPTDRSREVRLAREHRAESRSMRRVLRPRSVAVVGVSSADESLGRTVSEHILDGGFTGPMYAVGRRAAAAGVHLRGERVYASLDDLPAEVDLVVVAVPAEDVLDVVDQCGRRGTRALVVLTAGFTDTGTLQGTGRQTAMLSAVRARGMRLLGPNCLGMITTTASDTPASGTTASDTTLVGTLNASLAPRMPPAGHFGIFTQSASLGVALLLGAEQRGLGMSTFISAGNRCDISGNDLMQHWIDDEETHAVGLYLESMGNPRKFTRIARALSSVKPVIVIKSGVTTSAAAPGQVMRQTKQRPQAFDAMLRQSGVIKVENIHQFMDVATLVTRTPLPRGPRVAIVSNSSALGALAADACRSWDLLVSAAPEEPSDPSTTDDVQGSGHRAASDDPVMFAAQIKRTLDRPDVDSVVACFVPPLFEADDAFMHVVAAAVQGHEKPCVTTFVGVRGDHPDVAAYPMPEDAVRALAAATRHAQWRSRDHGWPVHPPRINRRTAHDVIESFLAQHPNGGELRPAQARDLLASYDIDLWPLHPVSSGKEAKRMAARLDQPVVVKATSAALRHEPGKRWVRLGLGTPESCMEAYRDLVSDLTHADLDHLRVDGKHPIAIQACAPYGTPVQVHTAEDPLFGPVVSLAVAGAPADLLGDITYAFPPLRQVDIDDLIDGLATSPVLRGYRGAEPVDLPALHDLIARMSVLADDHPEIAHARLNPVIAHSAGISVLGAAIEVRPGQDRAESERRALTR